MVQLIQEEIWDQGIWRVLDIRSMVEELILIIDLCKVPYNLQNAFPLLLLMTSPALSTPFPGCLGICLNGVSECKTADTI